VFRGSWRGGYPESVWGLTGKGDRAKLPGMMMKERPVAQTLEEANALLGLLWDALCEEQESNRQVRERLAKVEARLGQNSRNSSRPPSMDRPGKMASKMPQRLRTGRKPGGQPGHRGHHRLLLPEAQVDQVQEHWPQACGHCGQELRADRHAVVGEPVRHQVIELPPVHAEVTEHQVQRVRCPSCGTCTLATLPATVPTGAFGPRLQATVAILSGRYRLSRREVAAVCTEVLGAPLSVGSVDGLCQDTARALAEPVAELAATLPAAPVAHADETSWRQAGKNCWLWVVVTATVTVFTLAFSRGSQVIQGLLGEDFPGILESDRWSAYTWVDPQRRQVCWAHLKRDFQALVDLGGSAKAVGKDALRVQAQLFDAWYHAVNDPIARSRLEQTVAPLQAEFRTLLEAGQHVKSAKAAGVCRALLKLWPALWTFVSVPGVAPTNNAAERAIRPAVLWRKGSFGTQVPHGNLFVTRLLSVAATCQQRECSLLHYLTAVCSAQQSRQPIPSLLCFAPHDLCLTRPAAA